jgi:hypothetical protein
MSSASIASSMSFALDAVAQDHVRRVGQLIGVDADQARPHARHKAVQVVGLERRRGAEAGPQLRRQQGR